MFLRFVVGVLKFMDYFGLLPKFLLEVSPFHASVFFTSMGSLGIPAIIHHLYDFGNIPAFCAFGRKYRKYELDANGEVVAKRYMDCGFNLDERTVDFPDEWDIVTNYHVGRILSLRRKLREALDERIK